MTFAPTLFDAAARVTDPSTSQRSAIEDRTTLELDVLSAIRAAGWAGATTDDVWHRLNGIARPNSVARRITSLRKAGLVESPGARPGDSGRPQQVWRAVGHLQHLNEGGLS
jgi:hypothetical protein